MSQQEVHFSAKNATASLQESWNKKSKVYVLVTLPFSPDYEQSLLFSSLPKKMVVVTGNFELGVDPAVEVVCFPGAIGGSASQQLTLINNSGGQVAYKIKCTDNNVVKINPAAGLLPPGGAASVTLTSGPLPGPPAPQNIYIMNAPADGAPDAQAAFAGAPEGSGKVELDTAFE